jgi:AcrR family transcriptional regulator
MPVLDLTQMPAADVKQRGSAATRARLLDAAMTLFAERGYEATTVGDIERAAGMAPRSGALYQYFAGKDEVLRAALERQLEAVDDLGSVVDMLPLGDLEAEITLLARWNLNSLDRRAELTRFVRREGDRLPPALRRKLYDRLVGRPYDQVISLLRTRAEQASADPADLETLAVILIESMGAFRAMRETFGRVVDDIDDERFIAAWVSLAMAAARERGLA